METNPKEKQSLLTSLAPLALRVTIHVVSNFFDGTNCRCVGFRLFDRTVAYIGICQKIL